MPRKRRIHFQNAIYHVMMRGNYRQNIFTENQDSEDFYHLLETATLRYSCGIHLFCLMTNHIHIVIEISRIPLSKIMQFLTASYARLHNKRNKRIGHLFQGRYQAKLVGNDTYFRELCYYIHYNPVKAGMVKNIDDYEWSSHHCYLNYKTLSWVTTDLVLNLLQIAPNNIYKSYCNFIDDPSARIINIANLIQKAS